MFLQLKSNMAYSSPLAHRSNDHHARGIHNPDKSINHKVNLKNAVYKTVQLVRKFKKCCIDSSCEDCRKTKHKAMKLQQVKAITISPLHYEQTGAEILRWPPQKSGSHTDEAYRTGACHFLFTGNEKINEGKKDAI